MEVIGESIGESPGYIHNLATNNVIVLIRAFVKSNDLFIESTILKRD